MQNPESSQTNYRFMLSLTSLKAEEFLELLSHFDCLWQRYHGRYDLQGRPRRIKKHREHELMSLKGSGLKLLFVLIYLKNNPLQGRTAAGAHTRPSLSGFAAAG
jgi:hypothetical protein